jgi:tRNA threonylcarbamoyladenosine biosynthesis protein TsaE
MIIVRRSESLAATAALGRQLAGLLRPGDVVALDGELGSGKTTLVRAILVGLGRDAGVVSSPTFVVMNEYPGEPPVVHADAYRLAGDDELGTIGWERALDGSAIVLVEWADRIRPSLPPTLAGIRLEHTGSDSRRATISIPPAWLDRPGLMHLAQHPGDRGATLCPITGAAVPADSPSWPFATDEARLADLYRWMHGRYTISRNAEEADLDEGV